MVDINYDWEDDGCAEIDYIRCDCGFNDEEAEVVVDGEEWECPKCGKKIKFIWKGMTHEEIK